MSDISKYVELLNDEDLYKNLKLYGYPVGPIVDTTRKLYKRKLTELMKNSRKSTSTDHKIPNRKEHKTRTVGENKRGYSDDENIKLSREQRNFSNEYISNVIRRGPNNNLHYRYQQRSTTNTGMKKSHFVTMHKVFWFLVFLTAAFLIIAIYIEWQKSDPYKQVEEEITSLLEEIERKHKNKEMKL